jgi:hypothetical protein
MSKREEKQLLMRYFLESGQLQLLAFPRVVFPVGPECFSHSAIICDVFWKWVVAVYLLQQEQVNTTPLCL